MRILYAPFAASAPSLNGKPSPKDYPFPDQLAELLQKDHTLIQVGGNGDRQVVKDFRRNLSWKELETLIISSDAGVCVDSFLQHAFWYLHGIGDRGNNRRAIVLFGPSDPVIFGHPENLNLLVDRRFLRPNQFDLYYQEYNTNAFVKPSEVLDALSKWLTKNTNQECNIST